MLNPLIPLPIKTIEKDIRLCRCNDGHELFAYQKNALMTTALFDFWAENVFSKNSQEKEMKKNVLDLIFQ